MTSPFAPPTDAPPTDATAGDATAADGRPAAPAPTDMSAAPGPADGPAAPAPTGTSAGAAAPMIVGYPPVPANPAPFVPPMYWRVLRLSAVRPNGWQRAVLVEGVIGLSVVLALADVATAWIVVVLPLVSMAVVKAHDYLGGLLDPVGRAMPPPARVGDYALFAGIPIGILALRFLIHPTGQVGETSGIILGALLWLTVAILVYRYLARRGVPRQRAIAIGVVTFLLSPLAGALGATLEARRVQEASKRGVPAFPPLDP